jgi:Predicted hydrolases or acyltransferases (alpha/beta hydrolase superfamily)
MSDPLPETTPAMALIGPAPRIAVDHAGQGELVVFLHGIGGNRRNWRAQLPVFAAAGYRAVAWDARGYGDSDDYDGPLDFHSFRDDLARVLDHFGAETAHVVGLSMGGRIAASFHAKYPERVASLAFCDTHLGFAHFSEEARAEFVRLRKEPLLAGKEPKDIAPVVAETLIGDREANPDAFAQLVDSMSRLHKESYIKTIEASVGMDHADLYAGVEKPTLVVVGALDRLTTPDMAREIAAKIPGARLAVIEGAGHLSNIENPAAFDRAVLDFLATEAAR